MQEIVEITKKKQFKEVEKTPKDKVCKAEDKKEHLTKKKIRRTHSNRTRLWFSRKYSKWRTRFSTKRRKTLIRIWLLEAFKDLSMKCQAKNTTIHLRTTSQKNLSTLESKTSTRSTIKSGTFYSVFTIITLMIMACREVHLKILRVESLWECTIGTLSAKTFQSTKAPKTCSNQVLRKQRSLKDSKFTMDGINMIQGPAWCL